MPCCGGTSTDKYSSFSGACYTANIVKLREQLKKSKDKTSLINGVNEDGMSPLHRAAQKGNSDVIKFLLENDADPRLQSKKTGETALHIACFHRNKAAVEELLKTPAKQDVNLGDQHGYTPLLVAVSRGSAELAEMLLNAGANPTVKDNYGHDAISMSKYLLEQEEQGISSPHAKHRRTYQVVSKRA